MSVRARDFLRNNDIPCTFDTLTEKIINRQVTDICPMEKTVAGISNVDEAYDALVKKLAEMRRDRQKNTPPI